MNINCFTLQFINGKLLPDIEDGINVEVQENVMYVNGICSHILEKEPEKRKSLDKQIVDIFDGYQKGIPWVTEEKDGNYCLYRAVIDEKYMDIASECEEESVYVFFKIKRTDKASMTEGRILCRYFVGETQIVIAKFKKNSLLMIDKNNLLIILEWDGEMFIYR